MKAVEGQVLIHQPVHFLVLTALPHQDAASTELIDGLVLDGLCMAAPARAPET
ncbi:hypothetical protein [Streptomyces sp. NPDC092129]|uniref:hypothetical protein n=1 Tax=Streptomyces sp. NPDC092129 TaxID=3366010 RepID=UPI00381907FF